MNRLRGTVSLVVIGVVGALVVPELQGQTLAGRERSRRKEQ